MSTIKDTSHLAALEVRLSHERSYLAEAKTKRERELRKAWIAQIEKEIKLEKKLLGIEAEEEHPVSTLGDDDLLNALLG